MKLLPTIEKLETFKNRYLTRDYYKLQIIIKSFILTLLPTNHGNL